MRITKQLTLIMSLATILFLTGCSLLPANDIPPVDENGETQNVLINPKFEGAEEKMPPEGWTVYGAIDDVRNITVVDSDDPEKRGLLIEDNAFDRPGNAGEIGLYQSGIAGHPGLEYEVSVWAKAVPGESTAGAYASVMFFPAGTRHAIAIDTDDSDNFRQFTAKGVAPEGTTSARVYIYTLSEPTPKFIVREASLTIK